MEELAALLTRLPNTVLGQFCDAARPLTFHLMQADVPQSFTANFKTKNVQLFSDTAWVDLDDLQAWLRPRGDLDYFLDPTISERNFPPVGLDLRSLYGMDRTFGDATFDPYPAINFDQPPYDMLLSGYSFNPYNNYQSSNHQARAPNSNISRSNLKEGNKCRREEEKVKRRRREKKKRDHSASEEDEECKKKRKSSKAGGEHSRAC
ncbi:hypothetical protein C8J57DRAFT_1222887 [Mycena rebaudengoi]|nr:hypothetical protein C8J57DRAFT_1222887 [Mycena rebaudengoi]